ncbi:MAG TPA: DUF167 domain-containing protein [Candidatus Binatia bacterium]|nr:DUF167 domain-containing protein [Candidatus Binatia bacterium]
MLKFWVNVKPHSRSEGVSRLADGEYQVSVHAPPRDGRANESLIELLAAHFSVSKSQVKIIRGHSSRKKWIEIA